jgi:hypothetical protein
VHLGKGVIVLAQHGVTQLGYLERGSEADTVGLKPARYPSNCNLSDGPAKLFRLS